MVKIGTYIVKDENLSLHEKIQCIKDTGFDFICIGMEQIATHEAAESLLNFCAQKGLAIENVHLTGNGTHSVWGEGEEGDRVIDRYCREIALCHRYGIKTGIVHVTWGIDPPPEPCALGLKRFERVAECAEKHGVTVALENSVSAEHLRYALDGLTSSAIRFCFDSGHMNAFAPGADYLSQYGPRLAATHLQDNDGQHDLHLMPLDGCIDWEKVVSGLAATPYGGEKITAEIAGVVRHRRPGEGKASIRRSLERVRIVDDGALMDIYDGGFTVYGQLRYEEQLGRLYGAMQRIAHGIDAIRAGR